MKRFKGLLVFILVFISVIMVSKTKYYAEETQYTDNVIPTMTSNTSPSGEVNTSSYYTDSDGFIYSAWRAFDQSNISYHNGWASIKGTTTGWLEYKFSSEKCITKYALTSRTSADHDININECPKNWTFEAWDEEINNWVVLDTQNNITDWTFDATKEFTFNNIKKYEKYRINITANCGYANYTAIGELEMMESINIPPKGTWISGDRAILVITTTLDTDKEYDLSASEIDAFLNWYDAKSDGNGKAYFTITKHSIVKPFISRKEYINYNSIENFEVKDYYEE
ncbi:hypothetical protein QA584_17195 [Anaerocolumna sp. AGMB13025]|uniref:hypothetical protein n=1 Tax=Anaerocolumna sp. AGMB13025 TaxID=3039116 RepID=UPI00241DB5B5|nr:hypothetical protein [Anaerocolumna sp. AGMB13025]WFR55336.1 hypothetical protein QA584_17195 [Anaerocolumna sp. AGMB13025]